MDVALQKMADCIDANRLLLDIHLVDFITEELWEKNVPTCLQKCLLTTRVEWYKFVNALYNGKEDLKYIDGHDELNNFISNGRANSLDFLNELCNNCYPDDAEDDYKHCMKTKKSIEINNISRIVNKLCKENNLQNIIDVGSGKGYLSSYLALKYNFNVLGIDSQTICSQGAVLRNDKVKKTWKSHEDKIAGTFKCINHSIENTSPLTDLWCEIYPELKSKDFLLVGLHTCGDLSVKMMNLFLQSPDVKVFFNIGCCYNLLEEEFSVDDKNVVANSCFPLSKTLRDRKFYLGRKARMLAQQSLHRLIETKSSMNPTLYYRSLLQVIIRDKFKLNPDVPVGRMGKKCCNFLEYVRKSLPKLNLDNEEISNEEIDSYLIKYQPYQDQMECVFRLRSILAPVVESLIILDRYCYLKHQDVISQVYITKVCSPIHSPRCYAIIAIKTDFT
uniref:Methyltransferase domain-containing protein n=1 Tax=Strigamia maritima TaxID=126957 RepID=T1JB62_STRMM